MSDIVDIYTTCLHTNNRITFQCAATRSSTTLMICLYILFHLSSYQSILTFYLRSSWIHEILQINSEASSHVQGTTGSYWCGVGGMTSNRRNCLKRTMAAPQEFSVAAASISYGSDMERISSLCWCYCCRTVDLKLTHDRQMLLNVFKVPAHFSF